MKPSKQMQTVIEALATKYGIDLSAQDAYAKLALPHYLPLVIRNDGLHRVSVYHAFVENGDVVPDPQIIFWITATGWYPIEVTQIMGGHRSYARMNAEGTQVLWCNQRAQADLADFAQLWAENIQAQGWLARAQQVVPPLFALGRVLITPGAQATLLAAGVAPLTLLNRHARGDWRELDEHDRILNQLAVQSGEDRVFSAYTVAGNVTLWVITEADRSSTTLLLPREY